MCVMKNIISVMMIIRKKKKKKSMFFQDTGIVLKYKLKTSLLDL